MEKVEFGNNKSAFRSERERRTPPNHAPFALGKFTHGDLVPCGIDGRQICRPSGVAASFAIFADTKKAIRF